MPVYRVKQFVWGIGSYFKKLDTSYIDKFLDKEEKKLFNKLSRNDKAHSIRVCKDAIKIAEEKDEKVDVKEIAKLALLHDVGKSEYSLNIVEKSALVMLNSITKGKLKQYNNIKPIDIYYNHGEKGANLLKVTKKYDKAFLESVKNHHINNNVKNKNTLLEILKESDDKN